MCTLKDLNHSFLSSAFFLLKARSISSLSPSWVVAKGMTCLPILEKYCLASESLLVPNP